MTVSAVPVVLPRVLGGPPAALGPESLAGHVARLGPRPAGGPRLLGALGESGLRGRGGADFPTAQKWTAVASHARGGVEVVVNASEGEGWSAKDRTVLTLRPHLVLDGASLAAETVGARTVTLYVGRPFRAARAALESAIRERRRARADACTFRIVDAPHRYVAGESSAVVNRLNGGPARPTLVPPRPFERGVGGRPTLVQNTETLAHVALIARFGAEWFRVAGAGSSPGTALMTVSGAVARPQVVEVSLHATVGDVVAASGGPVGAPRAVLLGGWFGTWIDWVVAAPLRLDADTLRACDGASLGCGVLAVLPRSACGLAETARVVDHLAAESAGQCGPCLHGLASLARTLRRIAFEGGAERDVERLRRWSQQIAGRGACHHPDGAVRHLASALRVFDDDLRHHLEHGPCEGAHRAPSMPPIDEEGRGWR